MSNKSIVIENCLSDDIAVHALIMPDGEILILMESEKPYVERKRKVVTPEQSKADYIENVHNELKRMNKLVRHALKIKKNREEATAYILRKLGYGERYQRALGHIQTEAHPKIKNRNVLVYQHRDIISLLICLACVEPESSFDFYIEAEDGRIPYRKFFYLNQYLHIRCVSAQTLREGAEQQYRGSFKPATYSIRIHRDEDFDSPDYTSVSNDLAKLPGQSLKIIDQESMAAILRK